MMTRRTLFRSTLAVVCMLASVGAASVSDLEELVSDARSALVEFF